LLLKRPGFTAVAIITLALGIGANTAVFSVVNTMLLRPLPYNHSERLVKMLRLNKKRGESAPNHSFLRFTDHQAQNSVFEAMAAYTDTDAALTGDKMPEQVKGIVTSPELFKVLDIQPILGRTFKADDEQPGGAPIAVISYSMWQRRFASNPNVIGQSLNLDGKQNTIIGVLPANFQFLFETESPEYFVLIDPKGEMAVQRDASYLRVLGKLKPGITIKQADVELQSIAARLEQQYQDDKEESVRLIYAQDDLVGELRTTLLVLLGAVGFVLLIACANVANLQLTHIAQRSREIAIRLALGTDYGRIVRQLLTESLVLSLLGGALGLFFAIWGVDLISAFVPENIPRFKDVNVDATVLGFTLGACVLTGILFGLAPALQASKINLNEALKEGGRNISEGMGRNRMRRLLIISEVALSLILLISAGLLIKSFLYLRNTNPGFNPEQVLTATIPLPNTRYSKDEQILGFYQQLVERAAQLPGVEVAGASLGLPLGDTKISTSFTVAGQPDPGPGSEPIAGARIITPGYLRTLRIPLIKGRDFTEKDTADSPKVLLINETLARSYFPGEDPIGKYLNIGLNEIHGEIVGIVGDVRYSRMDRAATPEYYVPHKQVATDYMSLVLRVQKGDPTTLYEPLRALIRELDKDIPLYQVYPMERFVSNSVAQQRFSMILFAAFAGLALALASVGIFSVMSALATQRTHEIGVRIALGARPQDVLKLVVGQGMAHALVGIGIGLIGALALTRLMSSLLFEVSTTDPITFIVISLVLITVSLIACLLPACRATKVDPMVALRYE
ncbi:MAG: ABC transporter permease, partial [Acidobacteriota bacterium]